MNMGGPKDRFDEQDLEREEEGEVIPENSSLGISDDAIMQIIELFADESEGFYFGKESRIGTKEECIKWVREIIEKSLV